MIIYDISQEVFGCRVYPGDPAPEKKTLCSIKEGGVCNLTAFYMCAHNGTHVDAPFHFIEDGKTVDEVQLDSFVGKAYVAKHTGTVTGKDAEEILKKADECIDPSWLAEDKAGASVYAKFPAMFNV